MRVRILLIGLVGALVGWLDSPEASDESARGRGSAGTAAGAHVAALAPPEVPPLAAIGIGSAAPGSRPRIAGSPEAGYRSEGAHFYVWQPTRADVVSWLAELAPDRGTYRLPTDSADTAQS